MVQRYKLLAIGAVALAALGLALGLSAVSTWVQILGAAAVLFVLLPFALFHVTRKDWFHPLAFPMVYMGFVLAAPILWVFVRDEPLGRFVRDDIRETLILAIVVTLVATVVGTVLGATREPGAADGGRVLRENRIYELSLVILSGVVAVHLLALVTSDPSTSYGQNQLDYDALTSVTIFASLLALPATMLCVIASVRLRPRLLYGPGLVLVSLLVVLPTLQGDRSQALSILIFLAWAQHTMVRPIKLRSIVMGTALLLFAVVTVANVRVGNALPDDGWEVVGSTVRHVSSPVSITSDLMKIVPKNEDYMLGETYVSTIKYLPPGPIARALFGPPDTASFVYRDLIDFASEDLGFGFSLISEAYLNFGWYGLFFIPAGFGFLLGWSYRRTSGAPTRALHLLYPMLLALLPYLYRSDSLAQVKLLAYGMIVLVVVLRIGSVDDRNRPLRMTAPAAESAAEELDLN